MRKGTIGANLHPVAVNGAVVIVARTLLQGIERTIAKQTIQLVEPLVTRIVFARLILVETMGIFHKISPLKMPKEKPFTNIRKGFTRTR